MNRLRSSLLLLPWALNPAWTQGPGAVSKGALGAVILEGGSGDDQRLARAAAGLRPGQVLGEEDLARAVAAIKRVDRFLEVQATPLPDGGVRLTLTPLPPVQVLDLRGPWPKARLRALFPGLRPGVRAGDLQLAEWQAGALARLQDGGHPAATVKLRREDGGGRFLAEVDPGPPALVNTVDVVLRGEAYPKAKLVKWAGITPGKSLYSPTLQRSAVALLRERFLRDRRYEGSARLTFEAATGRLTLEVDPGPLVALEAEGARVGGWLGGQRKLAELVLFTRAAQWSPSLLTEGERHLVRHFRERGHQEVKVRHERRVVAGPPAMPERVRIIYHIEPGPSFGLDAIRFQGSHGISEDDLLKATRAGLHRLFRFNTATPELVRSLEDRVRNMYLANGYADVRVRGRLSPSSKGRMDLTFEIREGNARHLKALVLSVADQPGLDPERLAPALALWLADRPLKRKGAPKGTSLWPADRAHLEGVTGTLTELPKADGTRQFMMATPRAIPLVKGDLGLVLADLRQRLSSLGSPRPEIRFREDADAETATLEVPLQTLEPLRRLVVRGLDRTRPEAVLREFPEPPTPALDPATLEAGISGLSALGAFGRTDLQTLEDLPGAAPGTWRRGDLELRATEHSPWAFTTGFGYDRAQGYRLLGGIQRGNLGGMGRSMDLGIRAGDQTLRSKALREAFPTGDVNRSLDSYSLGYTDPWFLPGTLDGLLHTRTRLRMEGAYLEEGNAGFFARRRRFLGSLEWRLTPTQTVNLGYRFERADVASAKDADGNALFSSEELFALARSPEHSIISAVNLTLSVDHRDRATDPTSGSAFVGQLEIGPQALGTTPNSSFVKVDLRNQWNWPVGFRAEGGVISANVRLGVIYPTDSTARNLPLTERFFGGGPFSVRGVEPGFLGPVQLVPKLASDGKSKIPLTDALGNPVLDGSGNPLYVTQLTPVGGQVLATASLEYRFPLPWVGNTLWGEIFVDGGQIYAQVRPIEADRAVYGAPFPAWRVTPGLGIILKFGFPIKVEYATDWRRILGRSRSQNERDTQLRSLLISAGFQF